MVEASFGASEGTEEGARRRALGLPHQPPSPEDGIKRLGLIAGMPRFGPWWFTNMQLADAIKHQLGRMGAQPGNGGLS